MYIADSRATTKKKLKLVIGMLRKKERKSNHIKSWIRGIWLAQSEEQVTLDFGVVSSSPLLRAEITKKIAELKSEKIGNNKVTNKEWWVENGKKK